MQMLLLVVDDLSNHGISCLNANKNSATVLSGEKKKNTKNCC